MRALAWLGLLAMAVLGVVAVSTLLKWVSEVMSNWP